MANVFERIYKGINLVPAASAVAAKGDVGYNSASDKLELYNGAAVSLLTSNQLGNLTDAGTDGIIITGGTGSVIGSVSIAQTLSDATHNGYLSSTDWSTFNGKQAAGNYITALTGDATASGPGSAALTLATVNGNVGTFASVTVNAKGLVTAAAALTGDATTSGAALTLATVNGNVGSFGSSTSIPSFTVNAKGLITAASGNVVIAPAGTLSGTTLNATVVSSSLTSVGTLTSGTWNASVISAQYGGTGQASLTANNVILGNGTSAVQFVAPGTSGNVLTSNGTTWSSSAAASQASSSTELLNLGLSITTNGTNITVALKQADGSTDPASGTGAVKAAFRSSTITSGAYVEQSVTAALSMTIAGATTQGIADSTQHYLYIYLIDNANTIVLASSPTLFDEGSVQSTSASTTSNQTLYASGSTISNKAIRLIGRALVTNTGSAWTSVAQVTDQPFDKQVVSAGAYKSTDTTLTSGAQVQIVYNTKEWDTHNAYSTSTGNFTVPKAGRYDVSAFVLANGGSWVNGNSLRLEVWKNGGSFKFVNWVYAQTTAASTNLATGGNVVVDCAVGDTLAIYVYEDANTGTVLAKNGQDRLYVTFNLVG